MALLCSDSRLALRSSLRPSLMSALRRLDGYLKSCDVVALRGFLLLRSRLLYAWFTPLLVYW